jgi:hypothetical protein
MNDSSNALIAAIRSRLLEDPVIAAVVDDRVFDDPLETVAFPWIQIGDTQVIQFEGMCTHGVQVFLSIHVWVRDAWAGDVMRDLCSAIYQSLHRQTFPVAGHTLQLLEHQTTRTLRDPDGKTRHGIVEIRADTTAA